jgi:hypothetical protein
MVASQIKYWLFGLIGAVGAYIALTGLGMTEHTALGVSLVGGAFGSCILGGVWDTMKSGEKAATYERETRDEKARQALHEARASNAKQLDAPKPVKSQSGGG